MNRYFDMASYAAKFMEIAIAKCELRLEGLNGELAQLVNSNCIIRLRNIDNEYVRFNFLSPGNIEQEWELREYLDCAFNGRAMELRPLPPRDWEPVQQFVAMLETYNQLLVDGYFDAPLSGDFTWVPQYLELQAEVQRLRLAWSRLYDEKHPEAAAIWKKKEVGDPSWMDDLRRILAEREEKP